MLFTAEHAKFTVPAPWQRVDVAPDANTGVPTLGVIVIARLPAPLLHNSEVLFCDLT